MSYPPPYPGGPPPPYNSQPAPGYPTGVAPLPPAGGYPMGVAPPPPAGGVAPPTYQPGGYNPYGPHNPPAAPTWTAPQPGANPNFPPPTYPPAAQPPPPGPPAGYPPPGPPAGYPPAGYPPHGPPAGYTPPPSQPWSKPDAPPNPAAHLPAGGSTPRRYFYIRSLLHGKALDVEGGARGPGARVVMWPLKSGHGADNQLWYRDEQDVIRAKINDCALQFANGCMTVQHFNGAPDQSWVVHGQKIVQRNNPGICLDITGEERKDGATLCQYQYKGSANQHWKLEFQPPRYFYIRSMMNNKVLDIEAENRHPGAKVVMWPKKAGGGATNQLWYLDEVGFIKSKLNNLGLQASAHGVVTGAAPQWTIRDRTIILKSYPNQCLDIEGENPADGAKVCQFGYKGSANQHWAYDMV